MKVFKLERWTIQLYWPKFRLNRQYFNVIFTTSFVIYWSGTIGFELLGFGIGIARHKEKTK